MKKTSLFFVLTALGFAAGAQQPVKVTHLSVPATNREFVLPPEAPVNPALSTMPEGGNTSIYNQVQQQVMSANFGAASSAFDDFKNIRLPDLEVLFEATRNNPMTEYHMLRQKEAEHELKSVKRSWLKFINVNGSYRFGYLMASYGSEIDPMAGMFWTYGNQMQHWWSIGASVTVPFDVFDLGNRVRKQKAIANQSQYESETWYNERKLKIIDAYAHAGLYLALIKVKSEAATLAQQQYTMSQADFINGRIGVTELSYAKGIQNTSTTEYEQTRAELYKAILTLESISNYKILNK